MRGVRLMIGAALLVAAAVWSGQAVAAAAGEHEHQAPEGEHKEGGEGKEAEKEKSPFFVPAPWDLGIWTLAVFVLLMFVLGKYAWPPMLEGLKKREENIRSAQLEAEKSREEAKQSQMRLEQKMKETEEKVRQIHEEARKLAEQAKAQMIAEARAEIKTERDRLQHEFASQYAQASKDLNNRVAELATQISAKILRRALTPEDQQRLLEEAMAEIRSAVDARRHDFASSQL